MADIKIYGKLVANTEDQVVADASSIQDTARNQKLSVTLNELAQGTGLKVLDVNLNNYLSQDGLLALIQGINYATVDDIISYQFSSNIAVDSSYNAVHITASVSGQGGIDLYLLKSINDQFSCMSIKNQGYNSKYTIVQNASLIAYGGYIRGIIVANELVGNLCDLVNGRSELTSTKLTYWFPVGVLPTHIKLANDIIIDLQGNEYCAIGNETIDAEISNRVYLNVVKIDINGDFSNVSANDVKVVDFLWHHIENPNNFSFDDLPRFSDSSDVADFPGSSGGGGSQGGSGKLYEFRFNATQYDMSGNEHEWGAVNSYLGTTTTLTFSVSIYESNFEMFKQAMAVLSNAYNIQISCDTPQDFVDYINSTFTETSAISTNVAGLILCAIPIFADKVLITNANQTSAPYRVVGQLHLFAVSLGLITSDGIVGITMADFDQQTSDEPLFGLNANNSCVLNEYGTSACGGSSSSSEYPKVKEINLNNYLTDSQVLEFLQVYQQGTGNAFLTASSDFMTSAEFEEYDMIHAKAYVSGTLMFDGLLQKQVSTPAKAYGLSFGKVASSFANCCHIYFYMGSSRGNDAMNKIGVCATSLS